MRPRLLPAFPPVRASAWLVWLALLAGFPGASPVRAGDPAPAPGPTATRATILYGDGRPTETVDVLSSGGLVWFSAGDLSAIFESSRFWRADLQRITFRIGEHRLALAVGSDVAVLDEEEPIHLAATVLYLDGIVYVPLDLFLGGGGPPPAFLDRPVRWLAARRELQVGDPAGRLLAARVDGSSRSRLDLIVVGDVRWRLAEATRQRFVLRLFDVRVDPDSLDRPLDTGLFGGLTISPLPDGVEVSFAAPPGVVGYQIQKGDRPLRLSISLGTRLEEVLDGRMLPIVDPEAPDTLAASTIDTVMIDPGHGGGDTGTVRGELREEDLMLSLAREVALRLEDRLGVTALLTRDTDRAMSDDERTEAANSSGADLFLSLHCDEAPSPTVAGPRAVVARFLPGGARTVPDPLRDLGFSIWGQAQRGQAARAYRFADRLVTGVAQALGVPGRGVEEWPMPLLQGVAVPAVFLEVDVLTAPGVERRLGDADRRAAAAEAIVAAIDRFRRESP